MIRKIIHIDEEKCNGCGACVTACHEGAIGLVNGKAKLMRDDYCDGFGDCLPGCPTGAITFEEREAAAYDEQAVLENKQKKAAAAAEKPVFHGCPGSAMRQFDRQQAAPAAAPAAAQPSQLAQWPCQIKLVPVNAPYFDGAKLLIAADCTAYAYANIHQEFMRGHVTLIGCPKLDAVDYSEKLTEIIRNNDIRSVTVLRMDTPPSLPSRTAASSSPGMSSPSRWMAASSTGKETQTKKSRRCTKRLLFLVSFSLWSGRRTVSSSRQTRRSGVSEPAWRCPRHSSGKPGERAPSWQRSPCR